MKNKITNEVFQVFWFRLSFFVTAIKLKRFKPYMIPLAESYSKTSIALLNRFTGNKQLTIYDDICNNEFEKYSDIELMDLNTELFNSLNKKYGDILFMGIN